MVEDDQHYFLGSSGGGATTHHSVAGEWVLSPRRRAPWFPYGYSLSPSLSMHTQEEVITHFSSWCF